MSAAQQESPHSDDELKVRLLHVLARLGLLELQLRDHRDARFSAQFAPCVPATNINWNVHRSVEEQNLRHREESLPLLATGMSTTLSMFLDPLHNLKLGKDDTFHDLLQDLRNGHSTPEGYDDLLSFTRRHTASARLPLPWRTMADTPKPEPQCRRR